MPHGAWNGWYPPAASDSEICCTRGSCDTGGHGYCLDQWPSVGSSPWSPRTWYSHSALVYQGSKSS